MKARNYVFLWSLLMFILFKILGVNFILLGLIGGFAGTFNCSKDLPSHLMIEKPGICDDTVIWGDFGHLRDTNFPLFEKRVVDNVNSTSNMGGAKFYFPKGVNIFIAHRS